MNPSNPGFCNDPYHVEHGTNGELMFSIGWTSPRGGKSEERNMLDTVCLQPKSMIPRLLLSSLSSNATKPINLLIREADTVEGDISIKVRMVV